MSPSGTPFWMEVLSGVWSALPSWRDYWPNSVPCCHRIKGLAALSTLVFLLEAVYFLAACSSRPAGQQASRRISQFSWLRWSFFIFYLFFKRFHIFTFTEKREGREKEREKNTDRLPPTCPQPGTWPTTQAYALSRNQTSDLLLCGATPNWATPVRAETEFFKWCNLLAISKARVLKEGEL